MLLDLFRMSNSLFFKSTNFKIFLIFVLITALIAILFYQNRHDDKDDIIITVYEGMRHVFIDLGANNGDSAYNFFGLNEKSQGGKFSNILSKKEIDKWRWQVYAVEANSVFDKDLIEMKDKLSKQHQVYLYNSTVAWTYDGFIDFYLDTVNSKYNFWGSSVLENHPDVIRSGKTKKTMPCIDVARILKNYTLEDFVFLKMDIEGAEYNLLLHLILTNTIELVDYIAIEYHPQIRKIKIDETMFNNILDSYGIKIYRWF